MTLELVSHWITSAAFLDPDQRLPLVFWDHSPTTSPVDVISCSRLARLTSLNEAQIKEGRLHGLL